MTTERDPNTVKTVEILAYYLAAINGCDVIRWREDVVLRDQCRDTAVKLIAGLATNGVTLEPSSGAKAARARDDLIDQMTTIPASKAYELK